MLKNKHGTAKYIESGHDIIAGAWQNNVNMSKLRSDIASC